MGLCCFCVFVFTLLVCVCGGSVSPEEIKQWIASTDSLLGVIDGVVGFSNLQKEINTSPETVTNVDASKILVEGSAQIGKIFTDISDALELLTQGVESRYEWCVDQLNLQNDLVCCDVGGSGSCVESSAFAKDLRFAPYETDFSRTFVQIGTSASSNTTTCTAAASSSSNQQLDMCATSTLALLASQHFAEFPTAQSRVDSTFSSVQRVYFSSPNGVVRSVPDISPAPKEGVVVDPRASFELSFSVLRSKVAFLLVDFSPIVSNSELTRLQTTFTLLLAQLSPSDLFQLWLITTPETTTTFYTFQDATNKTTISHSSSSSILKHPCLGDSLVRATAENVAEIFEFVNLQISTRQSQGQQSTETQNKGTDYNTGVNSALELIVQEKTCYETEDPFWVVLFLLGASESSNYKTAENNLMTLSMEKSSVVGLSFNTVANTALDALACASFGIVLDVDEGKEFDVVTSLYQIQATGFESVFNARKDTGPAFVVDYGSIPVWFNHTFSYAATPPETTQLQPTIRIILPAFSPLNRNQHLGSLTVELSTSLLSTTLAPLLSPATTSTRPSPHASATASSSLRRSYVALVSRFADVIHHPRVPGWKVGWDVGVVEQTGFWGGNDTWFDRNVRSALVMGNVGTGELEVGREIVKGMPQFDGFRLTWIQSTIAWGGVVMRSSNPHFFSLYVVAAMNDTTDVVLREPRLGTALPTAYYHQLELYDNTTVNVSTTYVGSSLVTKQTPIFKFAPSQWDDPTSYTNKVETATDVLNIHNYVNALDNSTNPGFDQAAKQTLQLVHPVVSSYWLAEQNANASAFNNRQVYFGAIDGSMILFPGTSLPNWYDASARPWFYRAVASLGSYTFSTPYLDAGGLGGVVVTISKAICKKTAGSECASTDLPLFVGGYDFRFEALVDRVTAVTLGCNFAIDPTNTTAIQGTNQTATCLIIDTAGLLLIHWSFVDLVLSQNVENTNWPIQNVFLGELEGSLARQLVSEGILEQRCVLDTTNTQTVCFFFVTDQLGETEVYTSTIQANCVQGTFSIAKLPHTNALLVVLQNYTKSASCTDEPLTANATNAFSPTPCELGTFTHTLDQEYLPSAQHCSLAPSLGTTSSNFLTEITTPEFIAATATVKSLEMYRSALDSHTCAAETYVGYDDGGLGTGSLVISVFGLILGVGSLVWLVKHWNHPVIRRTSNAFNFLCIVGILLGYVVIFLTIGEPTNAKCHSRIYVAVFCFGLLYGSLFAKTWRLYKIFHNPKLGRGVISNHEVFRRIIALTLPSLIVTVVWSFVDAPGVVEYTTYHGHVPEVLLKCGYGSSHGAVFLWLQAVWVFCVLAFGCFVLFRVGEAKEFSERKYIAVIVYTSMLLLIITIPLQIEVSLKGKIALEVYTIALLMISSNALLFFSKVRRVRLRKYAADAPSTSANKSQRNRLPVATPRTPAASHSSRHNSSHNSSGDRAVRTITVTEADNAVTDVQMRVPSTSDFEQNTTTATTTESDLQTTTPTAGPQTGYVVTSSSTGAKHFGPQSRALRWRRSRTESVKQRLRALSLAMKGGVVWFHPTHENQTQRNSKWNDPPCETNDLGGIPGFEMQPPTPEQQTMQQNLT